MHGVISCYMHTLIIVNQNEMSTYNITTLYYVGISLDNIDLSVHPWHTILPAP